MLWSVRFAITTRRTWHSATDHTSQADLKGGVSELRLSFPKSIYLGMGKLACFYIDRILFTVNFNTFFHIRYTTRHHVGRVGIIASLNFAYTSKQTLTILRNDCNCKFGQTRSHLFHIETNHVRHVQTQNLTYGIKNWSFLLF